MEEKLNIKYIDVQNIDDNLLEDYTLKGDNYAIDDCVLVRSTDVFPFNGIVRIPKDDNAYEFGQSSILGDAINKELKQKYPNIMIDESQYELYKKEFDLYNVVFETCRSTVHFCMNGLVQSHQYGNFDSSPFVIIEPLKYHIDESLKCLRVEDVYFDKEIELSKEAVLIINEEMFEKIKMNIDVLESLKKIRTIVYKGNKNIVVRRVLTDLGYDSFVINQHGYFNGINDGSPASKMIRFITDYADQTGKSLERHFYSEINIKDREERAKKAYESDKNHLFYIMHNSNLPESFILRVQKTLDSGNTEELNKLMDQLVSIVGLDVIKRLTNEFNAQYISNLNSTKSKIL